MDFETLGATIALSDSSAADRAAASAAAAKASATDAKASEDSAKASETAVAGYVESIAKEVTAEEMLSELKTQTELIKQLLAKGTTTE